MGNRVVNQTRTKKAIECYQKGNLAALNAFKHTRAISTLILLYFSSRLASFGTSRFPSNQTIGLFLSIFNCGQGVHLNSPTCHIQKNEIKFDIQKAKLKVKVSFTLLPIWNQEIKIAYQEKSMTT